MKKLILLLAISAASISLAINIGSGVSISSEAAKNLAIVDCRCKEKPKISLTFISTDETEACKTCAASCASRGKVKSCTKKK